MSDDNATVRRLDNAEKRAEYEVLIVATRSGTSVVGRQSPAGVIGEGHGQPDATGSTPIRDCTGACRPHL